jgi:hypothetical protein
METWKPIPGYENRYEVSDQGRVRPLDREVLCQGNMKGAYLSKKKGRVLRPGASNSGHVSVVLGKGNTHFVHKLVLLAFVGEPPPKYECLHANGVPYDNRLVNLRWGTRGENIKDKTAHGLNKLKPNDVETIKAALQNNYRGLQANLARQFNVSQCTINDIKKGRTHV